MLLDCLIYGTIGTMFTTLGLLKLHGLRRGIVGGRDKGVTERLCGT